MNKADATSAPALQRHYERIVGERLLRDGRQLAAAMGLFRGQRVLELGCGTGILSQHLADSVGPEGEVLGLDALPLRVQIAHQELCIGCTACSKICPKKCYTHAPAAL